MGTISFKPESRENSSSWMDKLRIWLIWKKYHASQPGNRNKGKENGAGLTGESQSHCFADQYGNLTHTLLVQTHNMTTVKELAEQCRQL